jgi:hypothetical protein
MSNDLYIISNTNVTFKEPQEMVETVIQRLNNYPWDWALIDRHFPLKRELKVSERTLKLWKVEQWRSDDEKSTFAGSWGNGSNGHIRFYLFDFDEVIGFWLTTVAADLNITLNWGRYDILDIIRKNADASVFFDNHRRIIMQLCHALGGDRVIYLADHIKTHNEGWYMIFDPQNSFDDVEVYLREKIGASVPTRFHVFTDEAQTTPSYNYYIDRFDDLDK